MTLEPTTTSALMIPNPTEVTFALEPVRMQYHEYLLNHATAAQAKRCMDDFKAALAAVAGNATLMQLAGKTVATYRHDGPLNMEMLSKEQPDIVAEYTHNMWVEQFDRERFARELPALYDAYRGRRFVIVK